MSGLFGIELDNPTSNTVSVGLFELGASDSSQIFNGCLAKSDTYLETTNQITISSGLLLYEYYGSTTEMDNNPNTLFQVSANDVYLSNTTAGTQLDKGVTLILFIAIGSLDCPLKSCP